MSNALAIAGVTAVLEYLLTNMYSGAKLGSVSISAKAPDLVLSGGASGAESPLQVNLFLHQVTYNAGWRNAGQPSVAPDGKTRLANPPLALDLHYILTAYATEDCEAEALLGFAVQMMHETPVIARSQIAQGLTSLPAGNPVAGLLGASGLADQIEMIKITPATLGREELAWLWTALKADYRPTFPFQVSVVLIEPQFPTTEGLPVLSRNVTAQAGATAQLFEVVAKVGDPPPVPGSAVTLAGQALSGANRVALNNLRLGIQYPPFAPIAVTDTTAAFNVPVDPTKLPAGLYSLTLLFVDNSGRTTQSTNPIQFAIAPSFAPPIVAANAAGLLVTVTCNPQVLPNQTVSFALGGTTVPAQVFDVLSAVLSFQFPKLASGQYLARLRVDGVESPVNVNFKVAPPVFTGPWVNL
jgi:uncharacterized protein DUF4255